MAQPEFYHSEAHVAFRADGTLLSEGTGMKKRGRRKKYRASSLLETNARFLKVQFLSSRTLEFKASDKLNDARSADRR